MGKTLLAAILAACGWLLATVGGGSRSGRWQGEEAEAAVRPSLTLILQMMAVAMRSGSSIPHALDVIGSIIGGEFGGRLQATATALMQGYAWHDAWIETTDSGSGSRTGGLGEGVSNGLGKGPFGGKSSSLFDGKGGRDGDGTGPSCNTAVTHDLEVLRDALEDSWMHGVSPIGRLESAVEQIDTQQRASIDQAASQLSVKLLMPTGLCFLPAFMLIGIVPAIAAFVR